MESKLELFARETLTSRTGSKDKDLDDGVAIFAVLYDMEPLIPLLGFGWYGEEIMNFGGLYRSMLSYLRQ